MPAGPSPEPPRSVRPPARPRSGTILERPQEISEQTRALLVEYQRPDDAGSVHLLREGRNTIGRGDDNDIVLQDNSVSTKHAFLFVQKGNARLMEVSTNGSMVDGKVVHNDMADLRAGSILRMGGSVFVFLLVPEIPPDVWGTR